MSKKLNTIRRHIYWFTFVMVILLLLWLNQSFLHDTAASIDISETMHLNNTNNVTVPWRSKHKSKTKPLMKKTVNISTIEIFDIPKSNVNKSISAVYQRTNASKNLKPFAHTLPGINNKSDLFIDSDLKLSNVEKIYIPGANKNRTIYVMNTIYLPHDQLISIHLLGQKWWSSKDPTFQNIIVDWENYTKSAHIETYCLFPYNSTYLTSRIVIVPSVLFSFHANSTVTLLCKIPNEIQIMQNKNTIQHIYEFILITSDHLVTVRLEYNVKQRSIWPLITKYNDNLGKKRLVSLCMSSIGHPLPFLTENVAYYISQGIEHIYIGTFLRKKQYKYINELINLLFPWYESGQITFLNFLLPKPITRSGGGWHYRGQMHFNIQCLYLAKAFGDQFTLNTDADEFLVFHNNLSIYNNLKYKYYNDINDKCWVVFDSYKVWKLTHPN
eukprot:205441_1